ncbi:MAG: DOMON-like domain-containing protein [Candidatus Binatia bacterium]
MLEPSTIRLLCHPSSRPAPVREIAVEVRRSVEGLSVGYRLSADPRELRVPPLGPPGMTEGLWGHTCFEVFISAGDAPAYHELNLAPSLQWAVFAFDSYRAGRMLRDPALAPRIAVRAFGDRLELDAHIALASLSAAYGRAPLRIGLSAVVEAADGERSYWALRHVPGRPDFHHAGARALVVEPERVEC